MKNKLVMKAFFSLAVGCLISLSAWAQETVAVNTGDIVSPELYGAQNEAYMSRSAEKWVRGLCFNELGVCG